MRRRRDLFIATLLKKVRRTIEEHVMLEKGDNVVVGISGGPDSTALLVVLRELKEEYGLRLVAAHLNHLIRKGAAKKDADFSAGIAKRMGIPSVVESRDVPRIAKERGLSMEEAARVARYDFYREVAKRRGANKIALGHTSDDQAETVLMRLIRGSGLLGLSGIPPARRLGDTMIIRPLMGVSRDEITEFLKKRGIPYRIDATNDQSICARNKVRRQLIPYLEKRFSPSIKSTLADIGKNLRVDYDYMTAMAHRAFRRYARCGRNAVEIRRAFLREDKAIQRMIIREALKRLKGDLNAVTYRHWQDLERLLCARQRWAFSLPGKITARADKEKLILSSEVPGSGATYLGGLYTLDVPGRLSLPEIQKTLKASAVKKRPAFRSKRSRNVEYFDGARLQRPLLVRFKRFQDSIQPLGMDRRKKLKRLFIDEKVPAAARARVPLVLSGADIIWAAGVKRSAVAKITDMTKAIVKITITRGMP